MKLMPHKIEMIYQGQQVYQIVVYDLYGNMVDCQNTLAKDIPNILDSYLKQEDWNARRNFKTLR